MTITTNNLIHIKDVSNILGTNTKDLQILRMARSFNEFLKLDSEALLFALLKNGVVANISSIFAISPKTISKIINKSIEQKLIPDDLDIEFQLFMLNHKINSYLLEHFGDFFSEITDSEIFNFNNESNASIKQAKYAFFRKLIEYAYQDKEIDEAFYDDLFLGTNPVIPASYISREKLKRFIDYSDLCCGNNLFIQCCIMNSNWGNGSLKHLDDLLKRSKTEITNLIKSDSNTTTSILMAECLPKEFRLTEADATNSDITIRNAKINAAAEAYASYIDKQKEKKHATRCLLLKLKNYNGNTITAFDVSGNAINMFDVFKSKLVDDCETNTNETYFLDVAIDGSSFSIEKSIIRDFVNRLEEMHKGVSPPDDVEGFYVNINKQGDSFTIKDFMNIFTVIQRLYYMLSEDKFETLMTLISKGYRSAYDIVKVGRTKFINDLLNTLSFTRIVRIYSTAETKVNQVLALLNKYSQPSNSLMTSVIRSKSLNESESTTKISVTKITELETLFGNQDVTDTPHCESVLGPAAYLVDLLNLLKQIEVNENTGLTLYAKLIERRPDIESIPLNCQNALVLVPYIDLVIEILENWIVENKDISVLPKTFGWNTMSNEEVLKANPDYCCYEAYTPLLTTYSWKQAPFDLKNEEMKLYTKAMGFDRSKWAEILADSGVVGLINPYYDVLGFNSIDREFFKDSISIENYTQNQYISEIINSNIQDTDNTSPIGTQKRVLIKSFLESTNLNLTEFKQLLDSYYINPLIIPEFESTGNRYTIHFTKKIDLQNAYLEFLTEMQAVTFIYSMYQFRRIQLATGWNVPLLDDILRNIHEGIQDSYIAAGTNNAGTIIFSSVLNFDIVLKDEHIRQIGKIKKLQNDYGLTNNHINALFGKIRIYEYENSQSYFYWLFIDNNYPRKYKDAITAILNDAYTPEYVNYKIIQEDGKFHPFMKYVCSVLQISEEDIGELSFMLDTVNDNPIINRDNIVDLIRLKALLPILKTSLSEFIAYMKIHHASTAIQFVDISDVDFLVSLFRNFTLFHQQDIRFEDILYFVEKELLADSNITVPANDEINTTAKRIVSYTYEYFSADSSDVKEELFNKIINELIIIEPIEESLARIIANNYSNNNGFDINNDFVGNLLSIINSAQLTDRQVGLIYKYLTDTIKDTEANLYRNYGLNVKSRLANILKISDDSVLERILNKYLTTESDFNNHLDGLLINSTISSTQKDVIANSFSAIPFTKELSVSQESALLTELKTIPELSGISEAVLTDIINKQQSFVTHLVDVELLDESERTSVLNYLSTIPGSEIKIKNTIKSDYINGLKNVSGIDSEEMLGDIIDVHLNVLNTFNTYLAGKSVELNDKAQQAVLSYFTSYYYTDELFTTNKLVAIASTLAKKTGISNTNGTLDQILNNYYTCVDTFASGLTLSNQQQKQLVMSFFSKNPISDEALREARRKEIYDEFILYLTVEIKGKLDKKIVDDIVDKYINLETNNFETAINSLDSISQSIKNSIITYFGNNPPEKDVKKRYSQKLTAYSGVGVIDSDSIVDSIISQKVNFDTFINNSILSSDQKEAIKEYFAYRPFLIDTAIHAEQSLTISNLSKITGIEESSSLLMDIAEQIADLKTLLNEFLQESTKIEAVKAILLDLFAAFKFSHTFKLTEENIEDFTVSDSLIDIYSLAGSSLTFEQFQKYAWLLKVAPYLINPSCPFTFYESLINYGSNHLIEICKYMKWSVFIENPADLTTLPMPNDAMGRIQWFFEIGKLADLSINPLKIKDWVKWPYFQESQLNDIDKDIIIAIKDTAIDVLGIDTYLERVSALRDVLRNKQRDALVNFVISLTSLEDSNDLFSWLLIDTQMTPAVSTSRIVQATLAIQLLIQRIQFNLEPDIVLTKSDENKWRWMSLYRVWEANRKIFLYPENWLEPELRDDKSIFFKELEKDLTSSEITTESVESAYHEYLKKVEKIANIEYCQMFNEEYEDYSILHVIGRSPGEPHTYYYRKFVNESYWTAWEPLGFEINSEHIMPVVINDRFIVFWLECTQEVEEPTKLEFTGSTTTNEHTAPLPKKIMNTRICWSEYKKGEWTEKKMYANQLIFADTEEIVDKYEIRFFFEGGDNNSIYLVYAPVKGDRVSISYFSKPRGYQLKVEVYNNVELTLADEIIGDFTGKVLLPENMSNYYQKAKLNNDYGILSLPIASKSGTINKQVLDLINDTNINLIYPHQYLDFCSQSPYIVENGRKSLLFVPVIQPKNDNRSGKKVRDIANSCLEDFNSSYLLETNQSIPEEFTEAQSATTLTSNGVQTLYVEENAARILPEMPKYKSKLEVHLAYHPYIGLLRRNLERFGIEGILDPAGVTVTQSTMELLKAKQMNINILPNINFNEDLVINCIKNSQNPDKTYYSMQERFEFNTRSAYSIYNWELFFHIPYMIANHFYIEGNYDEALKWINYIFDPRETEEAQGNQRKYLSRFWKFKPFAQHNDTDGIDDILFDANMSSNSSVENNELNDQLEIWSNDPFKPHNVARLRISAYMKAIVMRYLDILIARGDQSFRVDTMESINEALQYYIIAAQLLGKKPEILETKIIESKTYNEFDQGSMGNAVEYMEESTIKPENAAYLEKFVESNELEVSSKPFSKERNMKNMVQDLYSKLQETEKVYKLYFGIPKNDKMFRYWELVGDRLFKIRNSMNIDGVKRTLSLFAPPIDPGMLAAAAAAGLDIKALVNGQAGPATQYRFNIMLNQALQLCGEIKALGSQLLSAYEKEDSEYISKLRANHEILLSDKVTRIREKSIEDAKIQIEQLNKQWEAIEFRQNFYLSREKRIKKENEQLDLMDKALINQIIAQTIALSSGPISLIPDIGAGLSGVFGSPVFTFEYGGDKLSNTTQIYSTAFNFLASIQNHKASKAGILAGYQRREEEWQFQAQMAQKEFAPLEQQKLAAEIRKIMAEYELENHKQQLKQSKEAYEVMKTKFTNEQLYNWMRKEIAILHRAAYDMAYKLAKQAEKAFDFELNPGGFSQFIASSHYDSKYGGLIAGEKLYQELKEMEMAYYENNKRKYELTKHVSLALLDPQQIIDLRASGSCEIILPELLFDMDHPGHCNRRIKSVSLTIPCVAGPYTSVSAELTLINNMFKTKEKTKIQGQPLIASMATSSAQNDSGLFQLNFNDERYLPFEGAGVESHWALALPNAVRQFDYNTISDVILTINYTAEDGGNRIEIESELIEAIKLYIDDNHKKFAILVDVKGQFPDVFEALKSGTANIELTKNMLPVFLRNHSVKTNGIARFDDATESAISSSPAFGANPINVELNQFAGNAPEKLLLIVKLDIQ